MENIAETQVQYNNVLQELSKATDPIERVLLQQKRLELLEVLSEHA